MTNALLVAGFALDAFTAPQKLHWNWRKSQELTADQSLRNAKISQSEKRAIAKAIANQLRHAMTELEINSEDQLQKATLDTRIKLIDLNNDDIPEVIAQSMIVGCGATGNCMFWIFQESPGGYRLLLKGRAQTFTIQTSTSDGFRDIVLSTHSSASESGLTAYRYIDGRYREVGCYDASWTVWGADGLHDLKGPRITPCR